MARPDWTDERVYQNGLSKLQGPHLPNPTSSPARTQPAASAPGLLFSGLVLHFPFQQYLQYDVITSARCNLAGVSTEVSLII